MNLNLTLQQRQQMSQAQIQSLEILAMDSIELNQFLKTEYLENPLLDHNEEPYGDSIAEPLSAYYGTQNSSGAAGFSSVDDDDDHSRDFAAPKENLLRDYLLSQLDSRLYSRQEWGLFIYLIECLDDNGLFTMPAKEAAEKTGASESLVRQCLVTLQQLEPYGIFSADLKDCLLRQLDALDINTEILTLMIRCHLQDIADGKISNISRNLHIPTVEVRKNIELIARLNPRPLSGFHSGENSFIIPDIILKKESSDWSIQLNDSWIENYQVNDYYLKMMETSTDPDLITYFKSKLTRVQFILDSIEQRRKTVISITNVILDIQLDYFEHHASLVPMTMSDVAEKAGIHTSTVSRAVKGKYLQYPGGSIFMKNLFTAPVSSHEQGNITSALVKQYIKEYIAAENKKKPYSDQALAKLLENQDIKVSRRAVAKYREELGIKGSFDRRSYQ